MKRKKAYQLIMGSVALVYLGSVAYATDRQPEIGGETVYVQRECSRERKEGLQDIKVIAEEKEISMKDMAVLDVEACHDNIEQKEEAHADENGGLEKQEKENPQKAESEKKSQTKKYKSGKKTDERSGTEKKTREKKNQWKNEKKEKIEKKIKTERKFKTERNEKKRKRIRAVMAQQVLLSKEDRRNLLRIVEAEATGEDITGKMLVASVVLNRVKNSAFPSSVTEVVFQNKNGCYQFSPVKDGRFYQVKISKETKKAVKRVLAGEDYSQGALYFMARRRASAYGIQWFDGHLTSVLTHGGHEFFR